MKRMFPIPKSMKYIYLWYLMHSRDRLIDIIRTIFNELHL